MSSIEDIRNGSIVIITPSYGNKEPIKATVSQINDKPVQPIINYTFDEGSGWAFYSQIERVIKL